MFYGLYRRRIPILRSASIAAAAGLCSLLAACEPAAQQTGRQALTLDAIRESGTLVVLTTPGPTTWFETGGEPRGYEVELAEAFAADLGVEVRYEVHDDLASVLGAIQRGEGHVAAAGITATEARQDRLTFAPAYMAIRQQLVCRRGGVRPAGPGDLEGVSLAVVAGSSYVETLEELAADVPGLEWTEVSAPSALPLLERVQNRDLDCTIADSNLVSFARLRNAELESVLNLTDDQALAWALPPQQSDSETPFRDQLRDWFAEAHATGVLAELDERWYGHVYAFDYVEAAVFIRRIEDRLVRYRRHFIEAADANAFEWPLLAAQAYQESHWDPDAVSPTGVRGIMMLTRPTARELGVTDRTDPAESIEGGAAYLADLYRRLPEAVTGDDRLYMALAAYNVGMGHIYDARRLAERMGRDKNSWTDLREVLPLLSQPEYYRTLRHGYARGHEPVRYVRNIRIFQAILEANIAA